VSAKEAFDANNTVLDEGKHQFKERFRLVQIPVISGQEKQMMMK
jgi:hypothetical protein